MSYKTNEPIMDEIREMIIKHLPTNYTPSTDVVKNIHKEENCTEKGISIDLITIIMGIMYAAEDPNINVKTITTSNNVYYTIKRKTP